MKVINDKKIAMYLNELGEEYKDLLLETLLKKSNSVDDLSVSELLRIDNDVKKYLQRQEDSRKNRKFLVLGITYVLGGIFMYLFSEIIIKFDDMRYLSPAGLIQLMSITMGFVGIIAAFYSFLRSSPRDKLHKNISNDNENKKLLEYEVISTWRELEGICNDIALENDIVTRRSVINLLENENLITDDEKILLTHFLKLRNSIVHSDEVEITMQEMRNVIKEVNEFIEKLNIKLVPKKK